MSKSKSAFVVASQLHCSSALFCDSGYCSPLPTFLPCNVNGPATGKLGTGIIIVIIIIIIINYIWVVTRWQWLFYM